jgi:hypothetical protein
MKSVMSPRWHNRSTVNASGNIQDTAQLITVTVSCDLVKRLYLTIGSQQERIATVYNAEIKAALFPQLFARPKLLGDIAAIAGNNTQETDSMVQSGVSISKTIEMTGMTVNYKNRTIVLMSGDIILFRNNFIWHEPITYLVCPGQVFHPVQIQSLWAGGPQLGHTIHQ